MRSWQRQVDNRDQLSMSGSTAIRDDLLRIIAIDSFYGYRLSEDLGREGTGEVLLQHTEQAGAPFSFGVRIDNGLFNQGSPAAAC
jgi:hypothetical protein